MKKTISSVAAISLLATSIPVYASPVNEKQDEGVSKAVGNLEVDINFALPIMNTSEELTGMTLTLSDANGGTYDVPLSENVSNFEMNGKSVECQIKKLDKSKGELSSEAQKVYYYSVIFKELPAGTYTLSLSGEGFKTTDAISVQLENYSQRVTLSNKETFLMGDFNKDGRVTKEDYDELVTNIKTSDPGQVKKYDLNRDGAVSILDLSYVHENLNKTATGAKIVETSPILDTNKLELDVSSTIGVPPEKIDTLVENLLTGNEPVGVAVTEDTPAQIAMGFKEAINMDRIDIKIPDGQVGPSAGYVEIEDADGNKTQVNYGESVRRTATGFTSKINKATDTIQIDLKGQVAVKKITIVITETTDPTAPLAEIGKVEFLNNVYEEIPAPDMNIPTITEVTPESEQVTVKWNAEQNVDGYELRAVGKVKGQMKTTTLQTNKNTATFKGLEYFETYKISIQSLNGDWESGYSEEVTATPIPSGKPAAPEGLSVKGLYKALDVSWKKNKNAVSYNLYYRVANTTDEFKGIENIKGLTYTIPNLENDTEYEVYATAVNEIGTSANSQVYKGKTMDLKAPITPNYKLINTPNGVQKPTAHIKNVEYPSSAPAGNVFAVADGDDSTSWILKSWDAGGGNAGKPSPIVEFDSEQTFDRFIVTPNASQKYDYSPSYFVLRVLEGGQLVQKPAQLIPKTSSNGKRYYEIKLDKPITTTKVQANFAMGWVPNDPTISIAEMKFYHYDSLENDVDALFEDELHVSLKEGVTQESIDALRERANTVDSVSGEYHPYKESIIKELDNADQLLKDSQLASDVLTVNQNITNTGNNLGMANDNQALGLSAKAGDELIVYVGTNDVVPELVFTQYYAESGRFQQTIKLQKGRNVIKVPKIHDMDVEKGGNIYVRYPNVKLTKGDVNVRVIGATKIPHLNVYGLINELSKQDEVKAKIRQYITNLEDYVAKLPSLYPSEENKAENKYMYDKKTSVLNTTDIETDRATLNVSATAIAEGLGSGTIEEKVDKLYDSLKAMEQLMALKYAERGVSENPDFNDDGAIDSNEFKHMNPKSRMNIKYQRMFDGAFMYASNNHVGIEYGSVGGLTGGKPYTFNTDGTVENSGQLFGWGIAHELGHMTDLPKIGIAETTNNIISLLAQTLDDKALSRLETGGKYEGIYDKVTSGTVGATSDVFVQLGMYWQLHLAYDNQHTAKMLQTDIDSNPENDSFYAKMSKRLRELTAEDNGLSKEQLLIRVASDAAGKNLTEFFSAWGVKADNNTNAYLSSKGYEKEARQIQYLNDNARRMVLNDKVEAMSEDTKATVEFDQSIPDNSVIQNKDIKLKLGVDKDSDKILGYEISRNGKVVGFTTDNTFTDSLGSVNNRVVEYEVKAFDYHLNETSVKKLDPVKVSHEGIMDKETWAVESNAVSSEDVNDEDNPHGPVLHSVVERVIDNKNDSVFTGKKKGNADPYVIVNMSRKQPIVGFKYTKPSEGAIKRYEVYVSNDKENWTLANSGTFKPSSEEESEMVYFNKEGTDGGKQLWSYDASYVKLVAKGAQEISIAELDIIAPPGDNIEIGTKAGQYKDGMGILKSDYVYDTINGHKIPKGSFIITGEYRGHPAFNASLLRDENRDLVSMETIFLAQLPNGTDLGEISEGTYITWITPDQLDKVPSKAMLEMYRVNDAVTLEGQRLVSDTLFVDVPETLPEIDFTNGATKQIVKKASINKDVKKWDIFKDFKKLN